MNHNLRITTWNANGLLQHVPELEIFLNHEKIDICLVSETHLTKQLYVKIHGFSCYHSPHPAGKAKGGSAVLIRNNILHHEEPKFESVMFQVTTINIQAKNKQFKISAIYCPPRHTPTKEDYTNLFKTLGSNFIIGVISMRSIVNGDRGW